MTPVTVTATATPSRRRLRVAMVVNSLDVGGLEKVVLSLLTHLDRERIEPFLVCVDGPGALFEAAPVDAAHGLVLHKAPRAIVPGLPMLRVDGAALVALRAFLRDHAVDVVHAHNLAPLLYGGVAARTLSRRPAVVYTEHNQVYRATPFGRVKLRALLPLADAVATCSRDLARLFHERLHVTRPVRVLYNGVATPIAARPRGDVRRELGLPDDAFVFGCVASLTPQKGVDVLIDAARALAVRHPGVHVVVVGDGPLRAALEARAVGAGLGARFRFVGLRDDVATLLAAFDGYVSASRWEGLPLALLEALGAGLTIVATRVGGVPEIVTDGVNGVLVPPDDPSALAASMARVVEAPAFRADTAARNRAKLGATFSLDAMVRAHAELYDEVHRGR